MTDAKTMAAILRTMATQVAEHPNLCWRIVEAATLLDQQAAQIAQAKAENRKLRDVQIVTVAMPDGSDVAAPCAIEGCQYGALEAKLAEVEAALKMVELKYRRLLWLSHGHRFADLYGDDGEMQCQRCAPVWDYLRMPLTEVEHAAFAAIAGKDHP